MEIEVGNIVAFGFVTLSILIIYTKAIKRYVKYKQRKNERRLKREETYIDKGSIRSK